MGTSLWGHLCGDIFEETSLRGHPCGYIFEGTSLWVSTNHRKQFSIITLSALLCQCILKD